MQPGITPQFPFQLNQEYGDFLIITELRDVIRQNFLNLLLTDPGERIMDLDFGVGLKRYLFENRTSQIENSVRMAISSQVSQYMPFISINNILFPVNVEEPNMFAIQIFYSVSADQQSIVDSLMVNSSGLSGPITVSFSNRISTSFSSPIVSNIQRRV